MSFIELKCVNNNVNLDDYLRLYTYVRENMQHPEWLGTFSLDEIQDILSNGGKIWLYYDNTHLVCSMFYIPSNQQSLDKRNIKTLENETGALGPIMVSPDYIGNGYMLKMLEVFNEYCISIGMKYIFTKAHSENLYSINNMYKDGYKLVDEYENERGRMSAFLKSL
ncbi:MAG: GNAT family N-acetyltransferase [Firmicutes bacterium]|nr:GNAT family N-acetyltransferase [Bacillota bacterium]